MGERYGWRSARGLLAWQSQTDAPVRTHHEPVPRQGIRFVKIARVMRSRSCDGRDQAIPGY